MKMMKLYKRLPLILVMLAMFFATAYKAEAASFTAFASGDWESDATWGTVGLNNWPLSGDDVTIGGGLTVTVKGTSDACQSIQIGSGGTGELTFNGTASLTVSGAPGSITVSSGTGNGSIVMTSGATLTTKTLVTGAGTPDR